MKHLLLILAFIPAFACSMDNDVYKECLLSNLQPGMRDRQAWEVQEMCWKKALEAPKKELQGASKENW